MSHISIVEAGVTADQALLDKYENAVRMNHEAEHRDENNHGVLGVIKQIGMGGGGAVLGAIGITAATCLTSLQGTILNNPVIAAIAVGGAVVGAAAGVFIQNKDSEARSEWHQETSAHLQAVEQQTFKRPDLAEQLRARREAGLAKAEAAIQEQDATASRRNGASIGMGAMFGPK